jgi:hypothetical protein
MKFTKVGPKKSTLLYTVVHCCTLYKHPQFVLKLNRHRQTATLQTTTCYDVSPLKQLENAANNSLNIDRF